MIISTAINIIIIVEVCFHIVYEFISKIYLLIHSFIHKDARFNLGVIFVQLFMVLSSRLFIYLFIYLFIMFLAEIEHITIFSSTIFVTAINHHKGPANQFWLIFIVFSVSIHPSVCPLVNTLTLTIIAQLLPNFIY